MSVPVHSCVKKINKYSLSQTKLTLVIYYLLKQMSMVHFKNFWLESVILQYHHSKCDRAVREAGHPEFYPSVVECNFLAMRGKVVSLKAKKLVEMIIPSLA